MYEMATYFTYKKSFIGENITNKVFNQESLNEKYENKEFDLKMKEFVSSNYFKKKKLLHLDEKFT